MLIIRKSSKKYETIFEFTLVTINYPKNGVFKFCLMLIFYNSMLLHCMNDLGEIIFVKLYQTKWWSKLGTSKIFSKDQFSKYNQANFNEPF